MANVAAGILMYRLSAGGGLEVFLAHPGGPFYLNKDEGVWTIPKGLPEEGESLEAAAVREFKEETGLDVQGEMIPLGETKQKGGKTVHAWAVVGNIPAGFAAKSNFFEMEWPPKSGKLKLFPEMDKASFFTADVAKSKINSAQVVFIERLEELLDVRF